MKKTEEQKGQKELQKGRGVGWCMIKPREDKERLRKATRVQMAAKIGSERDREDLYKVGKRGVGLGGKL